MQGGGVVRLYNRKSVHVLTPPAALAISVADMKAFLRVDTDADDAVIQAYIQTATEMVKQHLRRSILTETLVYTADGFAYPDGVSRMDALGPGVHTVSVPFLTGGSDALELPFPPLQSVTSVETYDTGNNVSTFSASRYQVDLTSGRIYLNSGETWPTALRDRDAVKVTYVVGYSTVPAPILEGIRRHVEGLYSGCGGMTDQVQQLLGPYRIMDQLAW